MMAVDLQIDSVTGIVTVAGAIDRETDGPSRTIPVRATSSDGSFTDQKLLPLPSTISMNSMSGRSPIPMPLANNVDENASIGTIVQHHRFSGGCLMRPITPSPIRYKTMMDGRFSKSIVSQALSQ
jgi:hypothetical protein